MYTCQIINEPENPKGFVINKVKILTVRRWLIIRVSGNSVCTLENSPLTEKESLTLIFNLYPWPAQQLQIDDVEYVFFLSAVWQKYIY